MKQKISCIATFILVSCLICSCAVSSKIGKEASESAKNQKPPDGKSLIYVYRTSTMGFAVGLHVSLNNKMLGSFFPKNYYLCTVEPGKYIFTGHGENEDDLIITTKANNKYYIEARPRMGFISARIELDLRDQTEGNNGVQKCRMIGSTSDVNPITNQNSK
jgi:hypothetical protein